MKQKHDSVRLFHALRKAGATKGIPYWGLLPKLAKRWNRTTRTMYAYTTGALRLPPALWDDLTDILRVLDVQVKGRSTDGLRPLESPTQFVKKLRKEYYVQRSTGRRSRTAAARSGA